MTNYIERYWRDATPADAIKEPPMVARFRIDKNDKWSVCTLQGIDRSIDFPWRGQNYAGRECQVYDAPDPGEGWRLIDVESETPEDGDEMYEKSTGTWRQRKIPFQPWALSFNRRRITPTVTYVPFTWEDREQLRGRWICLGTSEVQIQGLTNHDKFYINGICPEVLVRYWTFIDTGEPVGRKVME